MRVGVGEIIDKTYYSYLRVGVGVGVVVEGIIVKTY
jgi:hypothetical protein